MAKSAPAWKIALNEAVPVKRSKAEQEGFYKKAFQTVKDRWRAQGKIRNDGDLSRRPIPGSKYSEADNYWNAFDKEVEAELDKFPGIWAGSMQESAPTSGESKLEIKARSFMDMAYDQTSSQPWFRGLSSAEQRKEVGLRYKSLIKGLPDAAQLAKWARLDEAVYGSAPNQPYIAYSESDRVALENSLKQAFPWVEVIRQTLGGEARASLAVRVSADSKESWNRGIFQNSRYCIFNLSNGKLEALSLDRSWAGMRKTAVGSPALAAQKIIEWAKRKGLLGVNESAIRHATKLNDKLEGLDEAAVPLAIQKQVAQAFLNELPPDVRSKLQSSPNLTPEESVNTGLKHAFETFGTPNAVELKRMKKMLGMVKQLGINYDTSIIPAKYRSAILESIETVNEGWGPLNNFLIGLGPLAGIIQSLERPTFSELMSALKKYPGFLVKSAVEDLKTWWNDPKVIIEYLGSASDTEFYRIRNTGTIPHGDYVVAAPSGSGKPNSRNVNKLKILCDFDKWEKFKHKNYESVDVFKETKMKKKSNILSLINEVASQASLLKLSTPSSVTGYFGYLIKYDPTRGFEVLSGTKHLAWARSIGDAKKFVDDNLSKDTGVFGKSGTFKSFGEAKDSDREAMVNKTCPECGESWKVCDNLKASGQSGYIFCLNCGHHKDCHNPGVLPDSWKMKRSLREGKVIKEDIHGIVISEAEKKGEKCPTCKGYGFTGDGDSDEDDSEGNCKTCKGKGRIAEETEADWRKFHDKVAPGTPFNKFHKYVPGPQELCKAKLENGKPCNGSKGSVVHQKS